MAVSLNSRIGFQGNDDKNYVGSAAKGALAGGVIAAGATKLMKPTGRIAAKDLADAGIDTMHSLRSLRLNIRRFAVEFKDNLTKEANATLKSVYKKIDKTLKGVRTPEIISKTRNNAIKTLEEGTRKYGKNTIIGAGVGAAAFLTFQALKGNQKD